MEMEQTRKRNGDNSESKSTTSVTINETTLSPCVNENGKIETKDEDYRKKPLFKNNLFIISTLGLLCFVVLIIYITILFVYPDRREHFVNITESVGVTTVSNFDVLTESSSVTDDPTIEFTSLSYQTYATMEDTKYITFTPQELTTTSGNEDTASIHFGEDSSTTTTTYYDESSTYDAPTQVAFTESTTDYWPPYPDEVFQVTSEKTENTIEENGSGNYYPGDDEDGY